MDSKNLVVFSNLASRVKRASSNCPRVFVGIDGFGASGKSTLAEQLAASLGNAYLVHVDDFYLPSIRRHERLGEVCPTYDLQRLAEQVVLPASTGNSFHYQRYDWKDDELAEWIDVPERVPIILEGVFCLTSELRSAYTFKIWCQADPLLRLSRGLARDGDAARSMWVDIWMPAENNYADTQHPELVADLILDSSSDATGTQSFHIVLGDELDCPS